MLIWDDHGRVTKALDVHKVSSGTFHGYSKPIDRSDILGYHFAGILNIATPTAILGYVKGHQGPKLITVNHSPNCCDLQDAIAANITISNQARRAACAAFPFVSWLSYGDHVEEKNWICDIRNGVMTIMPIDFQKAFVSYDSFMSTRFPPAFLPDPTIIVPSIAAIQRLSDSEIEEPLKFFGFDQGQIDAAKQRRNGLVAEYQRVGLI